MIRNESVNLGCSVSRKQNCNCGINCRTKGKWMGNWCNSLHNYTFGFTFGSWTQKINNKFF